MLPTDRVIAPVVWLMVILPSSERFAKGEDFVEWVYAARPAPQRLGLAW